MSLSGVETLNVSTGVFPGAIPPLVHERLTRLGFGKTVRRANLVGVCRSETAANQFLDAASKRGFLVPVSWGEYRVVDEATLAAMLQTANQTYQRFIAWARTLPQVEPRVLFLAPRLWRDTNLSVGEPLPVVPIPKGALVVQGRPPQWGAFFFDVAKTDTWKIVAGRTRLATCNAPSALDTSLILRASTDPRFHEAAFDVEARAGVAVTADLLRRLEPPVEAPRGKRARPIGIGPPARLRILGPPWFMDLTKDALRRQFKTTGGAIP